MEIDQCLALKSTFQLDEMLAMRCHIAIGNDPKIKQLYTFLADLEANAIPLAIHIQENTGAQYIYRPEYYKQKAEIQSCISKRIKEIIQYYHNMF